MHTTLQQLARIGSALILTLAISINTGAWADSLTWDADTGTAGAQNGGGTWIDGGNNWLSSGVNLNWNNAALDTAIIGGGPGAAGTITVSGSIVVDDLVFSVPGSGNYLLSGGNITLAGAGMPSITTTTTASPTIDSQLSGVAGFNKFGPGMLTLGGANNYTGTTNVNAGVVRLTHGSALGSNADGSVVTNGTALQLQGGITVSGEALTLRGQGLTGDGNTGSLRNISGTNTWTGNITADLAASVTNSSPADVTRIASDAGHLVISGNIHMNPGTTSNAVSLGVQGNGTGEISGNITGGTAGVQAFFRSSTGSGMWTLSGTNTYAGFTAINGPLTVSGGAAIPDTSLVAMNAGSASLVLASSETIGSLISGNSLPSVSVQLGGNTLTVGADNSTPGNPFGNGASGAFWGIISGTGGLTKTGTGTLTLTGANTYTGATVINDGTLQIGSNTATGSLAAASNITINSPGILRINRSTDITLNNTISGSGNLFKTAAGTLNVGGSTGNTYSGLTTVNAGTLNLNKTSGNAVGGDLTIENGGRVFYGGGSAARSHQIADSADVLITGATSELNFTSTNHTGITETIGSLTFNGGRFAAGASSNWTVTGAVSVTGGATPAIIVLNSSSQHSYGSLTLTGMSATTGDGNPNNSIALFGNAGSLSRMTIGSGGLTLDGSNLFIRKATASGNVGSRLVLNGDVTTIGTSASSISHDPTANATFGTHAVELLSGAPAAVTRTFTIGGGGADLAISVPITNGTATAGGLTKAGDGTLNLLEVNTYTGATTVNAGTLLVNGSTVAASAVTVAAAGRLGGSGTIGGATNVLGIHAPGNSAGIQTFGSHLSYSGGDSVIEWELTGNTTTNAANPNAVFDTIIVGGNLTIADVTTLELAFSGAGSSVDWSDDFWTTSRSGASGWLLFDVAGTTTGLENLSINSLNWLDSNNAPFGATLGKSFFYLTQIGSDVYLNFNAVPIPEPSGLVLTSAGLIVLFRRRRAIAARKV